MPNTRRVSLGDVVDGVLYGRADDDDDEDITDTYGAFSSSLYGLREESEDTDDVLRGTTSAMSTLRNSDGDSKIFASRHSVLCSGTKPAPPLAPGSDEDTPDMPGAVGYGLVDGEVSDAESLGSTGEIRRSGSVRSNASPLTYSVSTKSHESTVYDGESAQASANGANEAQHRITREGSDTSNASIYSASEKQVHILRETSDVSGSSIRSDTSTLVRQITKSRTAASVAKAEPTYEFATMDRRVKKVSTEPNYEFATMGRKSSNSTLRGADSDSDVDNFYKIATTETTGTANGSVSIRRLSMSGDGSERARRISAESAAALAQLGSLPKKKGSALKKSKRKVPTPDDLGVPAEAPKNTLQARLSRKMSRARPSRRRTQSITHNPSEFTVAVPPPPIRRGSLVAELIESPQAFDSAAGASSPPSLQPAPPHDDGASGLVNEMQARCGDAVRREGSAEEWENIQNFLSTVTTMPPPRSGSHTTDDEAEH